eukprot:Skav214004  [mRNA]  locus=scaffold1070:176782:179456:- [translate_table: standard]
MENAMLIVSHPGAPCGHPEAARLLLDDQGRPGLHVQWIPSLGLQLRTFREAPVQADLFEGDVLSVLGSSSLAEAKTEEEALKLGLHWRCRVAVD